MDKHRLYSDKPLILTRAHFINSYPPFNVATPAGRDSLEYRMPFGLYIHIPFCPTLCTYCFYKKFGLPSEDEVTTYLRYLEKELVKFSCQPEAAHKRVKTIYFGGGTPSVLTTDQIQKLMACIEAHFDVGSVEEVCFEIMPHRGTVTIEKLACLKESGVTRLSFGVETFSEELLAAHNRPCTRDLYEWTYEAVRDAGFRTINIDMMSGLPGSTWDTWTSDIEAALRWSPPSISIYKTEVFYNTALFTKSRTSPGRHELSSDNTEINQIRYAHDTLQTQGGYVVADCLHIVKKQSDCDQHYRSIWDGMDLKGFGLSAHSLYNGVLHQNASELPEYYALIDEEFPPIKRAHRLTARERISHAMVYGLKNLAINRTAFADRVGVDMTALYGPLLDKLVGAGAVTLDSDWLRIAPSHYIFADDICRQFYLPEYEDMMPAHAARPGQLPLIGVTQSMPAPAGDVVQL